jgi:hypothetical protein
MAKYVCYWSLKCQRIKAAANFTDVNVYTYGIVNRILNNIYVKAAIYKTFFTF